MKSLNTSRIEEYLKDTARPLDLAMYNFHFRNGSTQDVFGALEPYQNPDGGFGNAIEPDLRLPHSTAIGAWTALQILSEIKVDAENDTLKKVLAYLLGAYEPSIPGWAIIRPETNNYPHAPWWDYESAIKSFGWGNPSAELLGFLIKYRGGESILPALKEKAVRRIHEVDPSNFHEVFNFKGLYTLADSELQKKLESPLRLLIQKSASMSPSEWTSYVATPLKFISSPTDPFIDLFPKDLITANLEFLVNQVADENHWEPNWNWSGTYPEDWETAKREWGGHLTVRNMIVLKNFGLV